MRMRAARAAALGHLDTDDTYRPGVTVDAWDELGCDRSHFDQKPGHLELHVPGAGPESTRVDAAIDAPAKVEASFMGAMDATYEIGRGHHANLREGLSLVKASEDVPDLVTDGAYTKKLYPLRADRLLVQGYRLREASEVDAEGFKAAAVASGGACPWRSASR